MSQDTDILMSLSWTLLSLKTKTKPTEILWKMHSKTLTKKSMTETKIERHGKTKKTQTNKPTNQPKPPKVYIQPNLKQSKPQTLSFSEIAEMSSFTSQWNQSLVVVLGASDFLLYIAFPTESKRLHAHLCNFGERRGLWYMHCSCPVLFHTACSHALWGWDGYPHC